MADLDAGRWQEVLTRLGMELSHAATVTVLGGVAMALAYGGRRTTKDCDVVFGSGSVGLKAAAVRIAPEFELSANWLNDDAAKNGFVYGPPNSLAATTLTFGALEVRVVSPEWVLAMKLAAFRGDVDIQDAVILAKILEKRMSCDADQLWNRIGGFVPRDKRERARHNLEDVWEMAFQ